MKKKYQVFVSSTSGDLELERREVFDALLRSEYIPIGMEFFQATNDAAWPTIARMIDACDYFVVLVGGRYGSIRKVPEARGVSFTESEYLYAVQSEKPVLAFLRRNPPVPESEDATAFTKVRKFRKLLEERHHCGYWGHPSDSGLATQVVIGLNNLVESQPEGGWIPAGAIDMDLVENLMVPGSELGIRRISVSGRAGIVMSENIERAKSINVISTSAPRIVELEHKPMVKAVARGASIRFLVPAPDSDFISDVEESERRPPRDSITEEVHTLKTRLSEVMEGAIRLSTRPDFRLGSAQIGYFTTHLRSTIIICDDAWAWLTITLPPLRASQTASFELTSTGESPLLQDCVEHFDRTWEVVAGRGHVVDVLPSSRRI